MCLLRVLDIFKMQAYKREQKVTSVGLVVNASHKPKKESVTNGHRVIY